MITANPLAKAFRKMTLGDAGIKKIRITRFASFGHSLVPMLLYSEKEDDSPCFSGIFLAEIRTNACSALGVQIVHT